jgi:murein L,D-transpeptidase YcbB/YkuD
MSRLSRRTRTALLLSLAALATGAACRQGALPPVASGPEATPTPVPTEPPGPPAAEVAAAVERFFAASEHPWLKWSTATDVAPALAPLYDTEADRLFWFAGETPYPALEQALQQLADAGDHGLDPADYDAKRLADAWTKVKAGGAPGTDRALLDTGLSVAVARFLSAAHAGRVDPAAMKWGYDEAGKTLDLPATLRAVREMTNVGTTLHTLEPPFPHYERARRTVALYRGLAAAGEPPPVPDLEAGRRKVEPGKPWAGVPVLAARLRVFGDLAKNAPPPAAGPDGLPLYDGALVDAVKSFQGRHGLDPDGVIGAGTLETLNVPLAHRVRQLELAMERMRWLPDMHDRASIFVNVALYRLWANDPASGQEPERMRVVVGQSLDHQTPIFLERMEYVVFRPYWNPPYGITRKEILPKARRDPSYLARQHYEIVASGDDGAPALPVTAANLDQVAAGRLFIRQTPGPHNSLGLVKFMFPNDDQVYMHGTPAQSLFSRARRDFSHGCIRLEDPARLAAWVLRDQPDWTPERIKAAMDGPRPTRVNLKQPITVVLFYDTVHVNSEGVVFFVDDIYGHDRALDAALRKGYPYPRGRRA